MSDRPIKQGQPISRKTKGASSFGKASVNISSLDREDESICPVVGIVASAGGLSAFNHLFKAMPANSGAAFVLVPHLDLNQANDAPP